MSGFFEQQQILPAARTTKELERFLETEYKYIVLLNSHVAQLRSLMSLVKAKKKLLFLHADLVQGLKTDEFAAQFLAQEIRPYGLISTRKNVVLTAKKHKLVAVQRLFLLDSQALESSYKLLEITQPDFIEVLPGVMPHIIKEVFEHTKIPIIAGGLVRTRDEVDAALSSGAVAVSTSKKELWR
ncbi:glycerol-3-phosphate responsive antiterminator [Halalkalibacterium halodurans]|uniref:glycerol-3-phosphate responsive antiterminator n=1 Tax=Halalkalibacterium halodurans TaxID=86665 RepID=UPI002AA96643|nr:glycerol-3-phosphate responsive antiterminator [Halalkalibacterium halodurans]MDY7221624.1 glycerol-3-phosphate responsive antiterminator [Halalkalibacterium halodurans]MDY7240900.1 glycerol-3-phosphate responsive antiterminator [Halalkalibacterium halodurans]MED4079294.1 glycerol-3-phosphate responsive antiterminator [Halalkalibacterium halodurans]MED4085365.1 glycerol-3-phosphate responsive antiterminator [Halalkalibacterium halodurans]MED4104511.1 glycerol-3-phosphate responsive antiterm